MSTHHLFPRTKNTERYYTPEVKKKVQEREQYQEALQLEAQKAYLHFLSEIAQHYAVMRNAVDKLATADCLLSLALVALQENYVRPQFTDEDVLEIVDGRHPMVEAIRSDPFVPNTVKMGSGEPRSKIITGPNMGGKSSSVRMVALITVMAQIGSYVPATSVRLGMHDSILTRMGGE
jgi:DNA mismatch repair protein MSH3